MSTSQRYPHFLLREFTRNVLNAINSDNDQTEVFTDALLWSDLIGRPNHGIWRLPAYVNRIRTGAMKCPCAPRFERQGLATEVMDGDNGIGHFVGHIAMLRAIENARQYGIGAVGVHNSNHFGTGAYFVQLAAQQDMIGLAFSNSIAKVAPHGGVNAVFGTNPFAFAAPRNNGESLLLDMTTAAMSGSEVMRRAESGTALPEGIAVNSDGSPILNPADIGKGVLLGFGGYKGSGIALMVEILCSTLTGAMPSTGINSMFDANSGTGNNGHFFMAISIAHFMQLADFNARLELLLGQVAASGTGGSVHIPGEGRWLEYEKNLRTGLPLDEDTLVALDKLAAELEINGVRGNKWGQSKNAVAR